MPRPPCCASTANGCGSNGATRALRTLEGINTPYRMRLLDEASRGPEQSDVMLACAAARKLGAGAYSPSHFVPIAGGGGVEVMEFCVPIDAGGYLVASYSLRDAAHRTGRPHAHAQPGGVLHRGRRHAPGAARQLAPRGTRVFTAQQLLDLPGNTMVLRMDSWRGAPDLFPNVLTALVTLMSIALVSVLCCWARDTRRRLRAERDLADALAFRKAMEDSLVTGLRARDLQGRITYVNPAFCQMVGFSPEELLGQRSAPAPYWPPELADEYQQRQEVRLAGGNAAARRLRVGLHAQGRHALSGADHRGAADQRARRADRLDERVLDISEQRRVEELSRASQERLQATARLATVGEMASLLSHELNQPLAAICQLRHRLAQPAGSARAGATRADLQVAMRRIAEQADRAGQVIKSVHDFVRRRDQHARGRWRRRR
jgi:two-component system sensor histidine kinase DctS